MSSPQILVTGGAGYIGSHMTWRLLDAGLQPVVLDDLSTGQRAAVAPSVPFYHGDCGDQALLERIFAQHNIEAVIHFAASIIVSESVIKPQAYYRNNVVNAQALLDSAVRHGVPHFVFSSSAAVYGEAISPLIGEDEPKNPINPYGRSKLMMEWMLEDAARAHPIRYAALRYFNVAGADPLGRTGQHSTNATHLIKIAVQAACGERAGMDVFGTDYPTPDGSCIRDYVHVSDLAEAHLKALEHLRAGHDSLACNIGYGVGYSVLDVIKVVKNVSGVDFEMRVKDRRAGDPASLVASNNRALAVIGWLPRYNDLETIVRHALNWEAKLSRSAP